VHFVIIPASVVKKLARKKEGGGKKINERGGGSIRGVLAEQTEHFRFVRHCFVRFPHQNQNIKQSRFKHPLKRIRSLCIESLFIANMLT